MADAALIRRVERELAQAGLQVGVDSSDGTLVLVGLVDTEESRRAAEEIASQVAPDAKIDNQLEIQAVFPPDIDVFVSDDPSAELPENRREILAGGGDIDPDFTDRPGLTDPIAVGGGGSDEPDDAVDSGDTYTPPIDPVLTTGLHGEARVLGGFEVDSAEDVPVERSASDGQPGDEALADAVRRELAEDAATTDLTIYVTVRNGVAHLRGRVADLDETDNAESVAAGVPGIRDVQEELEVANV